jgi:hypothetical protein
MRMLLAPHTGLCPVVHCGPVVRQFYLISNNFLSLTFDGSRIRHGDRDAQAPKRIAVTTRCWFKSVY